MLERALDVRVPAAWATADEAYGSDLALRRWLADRARIRFRRAVSAS